MNEIKRVSCIHIWSIASMFCTLQFLCQGCLSCGKVVGVLCLSCTYKRVLALPQLNQNLFLSRNRSLLDEGALSSAACL